MIATCGGCPAKWSGFNTSHCASCHVSFGGLTGFDRHRRGGKCLPPAEIGLTLSDTREGIWVHTLDAPIN